MNSYLLLHDELLGVKLRDFLYVTKHVLKINEYNISFGYNYTFKNF
jgi:hypothetical protein